jgi:hypothetical protein
MNTSLSLPSGMFWQIFRKDWRLLWPLAVASAVIQALLELLLYHSEPYSISEEVSAIAALLTLALAITMVLLIVLAVQQDAIPGVSQDWLVRPIKRGDLLLAKLLAVVLLIHGPMVAIGLLHGIAEGFPLGPVLRATLLSNFEVALVFSLPVMAVAALTRSVGEAIIVALAIFLGLMLARLVILAILFPVTGSFHFFEPVDGTGVAWVWQTLSHALLLLVTIAVLVRQYYRRSTSKSRVLFAVGLLLFMFVPGLPWRPAFAIQRWFAANPDANHAVSIAFDPESQRTQAANTSQLDNQLFKQDSDGKKSDATDSKELVSIAVPLRVSGLSAGLILHSDRAAVRLVGADGKTLYRGTGQLFDMRSESSGDDQGQLRQTVQIPAAIYRKAADQPLRLELDYFLTLLRSHTLAPLRALNDNRRLPDVGWCASRIDTAGTAIEVGCRQAGESPPCISMVLEHPSGARRNPEKFICELNYEPAGLRFSTDEIDHVQTKLPFRDPTGLAHFPVDETQLSGARIVISVYEPEDHFSRHLSVPQFRLSDWRVAPAAASDKATASSAD